METSHCVVGLLADDAPVAAGASAMPPPASAPAREAVARSVDAGHRRVEDAHHPVKIDQQRLPRASRVPATGGLRRRSRRRAAAG